MVTTRKNIVLYSLGAIAIVSLYIGSYCILSISGSYRIGASGIGQGKDGNAKIVAKWYNWLPAHFMNTDVNPWKPNITMYFYFPLYVVDIRWWHTENAMYTKMYKVTPFLGDEHAEKFDKYYGK